LRPEKIPRQGGYQVDALKSCRRSCDGNSVFINSSPERQMDAQKGSGFNIPGTVSTCNLGIFVGLMPENLILNSKSNDKQK
jgi:hypothetical protein